jgi:uncharacterized protein YkwD
MRKVAFALLVAACSNDTDEMPQGWDAVPALAHCDDARDWDAVWTEAEETVLAEVNARREAGADCGAAGMFRATDPLAMDPALRCAARLHSADMAEREFFAHDNPSGESPFVRMEQVGYAFSTAGENIAGGNADAVATVDQWMQSDPHCSNIMNPGFRDIGVGYHPGGAYGHLWTQTFGAP